MNACFSSAIKAENRCGFATVIPDIKCISPKEGDLLRGRDPIETAKMLVERGAPVLSVVTERKRYGGSPALLRAIVEKTGVPVLRKDFINQEEQLVETVAIGADAVLLICTMLDENKLRRLYATAISLGLEPLVEVCTAQEMEWAIKLGARLIGVNNRDIATFEMDSGGPSRTAALASHAPKGALLVSESGILSAADAKLAVEAGANAVLVGTALWQADDMAAMYASLRTPVPRTSLRTAVKICGLKRMEDIAAVNASLPDYVGFVFAESRHVIDKQTATMLKQQLDNRIKAVGVFVNQDITTVADLLQSGIIDAAQLHGDEDDAYIASLKARCDCNVIKAVGVRDAIPSLSKNADFLLFDTLSKQRGGTGKVFNWDVLKNYNGPPFFLAGGLKAENIADAIGYLTPLCVDISSGAETNGVKDAEKINEIVRVVRGI